MWRWAQVGVEKDSHTFGVTGSCSPENAENVGTCCIGSSPNCIPFRGEFVDFLWGAAVCFLQKYCVNGVTLKLLFPESHPRAIFLVGQGEALNVLGDNEMSSGKVF